MVVNTREEGAGEWRCVASLDGHQGAVYDLAAENPDLMWSVGGDGCLVRWRRTAGTWNAMGEAVAKADEALFCVHSRSDGGVVCGGASGGVVVWNEGRVEFHQGHEGGTFVVSDSMSGGADGHVRLWKDGQSLGNLEGRVRCLMVRGGRVWAGTHDGMAHCVGESGGGRVVHRGCVRALVEWPGKPAIGTVGADGRIRIWEEKEEELSEVVSVEAHKGAIYRLVGSPDSRWMATASRDRSAAVWRANDLGLEVRLARPDFEGHRSSVNALCWLDHRTMATGGDDRRIIIWERNPD